MFKKMADFLENHQRKIWIGFGVLALVLLATSIYLQNTREIFTINVVSEADTMSTAPTDFEFEMLEDVAAVDYSNVSTAPIEGDTLVQNLVPLKKLEREAVLQKSVPADAEVELVDLETRTEHIVRITEEPTLVLKDLGDISKNNYYIAELKELANNDKEFKVGIVTDMPVMTAYYVITAKTTGIELYRGSIGLVHNIKGDVQHSLTLNKAVFGRDDFLPEWKNEVIKFYFETGYDSNVVVEPNFITAKKFVSIKDIY